MSGHPRNVDIQDTHHTPSHHPPPRRSARQQASRTSRSSRTPRTPRTPRRSVTHDTQAGPSHNYHQIPHPPEPPSQPSYTLTAHTQSTSPQPICVEPTSSSSEPGVIPSSTVHVPHGRIRPPRPVLNDTEPSSDGSATSHRLPPQPSSHLVWHEYPSREEPMETVQRFIQELMVIDITHVQDTTNKVPLCPFILAHLQPSNRIIPHIPLSLPSCPAYVFYLLYVLKETLPTSQSTEYIAVFSMIFTGPSSGHPSLVGSRASIQFVEKIQANVEREKQRINELFLRLRNVYFPLRRYGI